MWKFEEKTMEKLFIFLLLVNTAYSVEIGMEYNNKPTQIDRQKYIYRSINRQIYRQIASYIVKQKDRQIQIKNTNTD